MLLKHKILNVVLLLVPIIFLSWTNKLFTSTLPVGLNNNSYMVHAMLLKGMQVQKTSPFEINDARGIKILQREKILTYSEMTVPRYLELIKRYPIDFVAMYSIRLFNGLDIKYSQVYAYEAYDSDKSGILFSIINYVFLFLGLYYMYNYITIAGVINKRVCYLLAIILPSISMVISFVETRYFLSLSIILIAIGCCSFNIRFLYRKSYIVKLVIFLICCFTVSGSVYNQSLSHILF